MSGAPSPGSTARRTRSLKRLLLLLPLGVAFAASALFASSRRFTTDLKDLDPVSSRNFRHVRTVGVAIPVKPCLGVWFTNRVAYGGVAARKVPDWLGYILPSIVITVSAIINATDQVVGAALAFPVQARRLEVTAWPDQKQPPRRARQRGRDWTAPQERASANNYDCFFLTEKEGPPRATARHPSWLEQEAGKGDQKTDVSGAQILDQRAPGGVC